MKRIEVKPSGMPLNITCEIDDDTIAIGDLIRVPPATAQASSRTARPKRCSVKPKVSPSESAAGWRES
jgi:hypothetical protein